MENEKSKGTQKFDLEGRLIDFSLCVIDVVESLPNSRVGSHIANQLVRSGTSPAANYGEALSAESRSYFIHKMRVSLKELRETRIWLLIIQRKGLVKPEAVLRVLKENCELIAIFAASINTAKKKSKMAG
ncbi:MAG: four helix bundle protein [Sedimentisphaerales bacterium]|jgi:four helix bundle protein